MKALVRHGNTSADWVIEEVKEPIAKKGELKIKVASTGICGSELHMYLGHFQLEPHIIPGHEFSGTVVEVGEGVEGFQVGDRITAEHTYSVCEKCEACRRGQYQLCKERISLSFNKDGSFAEYVIVNSKYTHHLPDNVSMEEASMVEPLSCALHAVSLVEPQPMQKTLVVGPGPVGLLTALCLKAHNCQVEIVGAPSDGLRLEKARDLDIDVIEAPKENYYDLAVDCSGHEKGINGVLKAAKRGGTVLQVGIPGGPVSINMDPIWEKELKIQGTYCHNYPDWEKALQYLSSGLIDIKPIMSEKIGLEDWEKAFKKLLNQEAIKIIIQMS